LSKSRYNVTLIILITIFQAMIFAYVIERVFGESRGLSILDMQYLLISYSIFSIIFEMPAGVIADLWKKKYTLALGIGLCFFEFFISIFAFGIPMFALVYFTAALGGSLKSGTMESILYQTLKNEHKEKSYVKISGQLKFIKYVVYGMASITGGVIADNFGYEMNYWLSLIGFPFAIIFILCLHEPTGTNLSTPKQTARISMVNHIQKGLKLTWKNTHLRNVILVSAVIGGILYGQLHEMSMLIYPEQGIPVKYFGVVSLGITVISALSGFMVERMKEGLKHPSLNVLTYLIPCVSIFLFGSVYQWWGVIFLMIAIGTLEALTVIYSGTIQDESPDDLRVTISSVSSFFHNAVSIVIGLLFGYYAQWFSIHVSFQMLGFLLFILLFVKVLVFMKKRLASFSNLI
jgi:MFS family permease